MNRVQETPKPNLAERVERLEREVRVWRRAGVPAVVLTAATFVVGATAFAPEWLAARTFRVVDTQGAEHATISTGDHGALELSLSESDTALILSPGRPALSLRTADGLRPVAVTAAEGESRPERKQERRRQPDERAGEGSGEGPEGPSEEEDDDDFDWVH